MWFTHPAVQGNILRKCIIFQKVCLLSNMYFSTNLLAKNAYLFLQKKQFILKKCWVFELCAVLFILWNKSTFKSCLLMQPHLPINNNTFFQRSTGLVSYVQSCTFMKWMQFEAMSSNMFMSMLCLHAYRPLKVGKRGGYCSTYIDT